MNMPKSPAEEAKTKAAALPEEEPTGYAAKKEEIVPAGAEGRTPAKSAEEYHPAVEQKVNELSDENLRKLAKAHGLNPDEYDFNARDERRHRVERDQLSKDITAQLGEDEKINLGRAAEATEKQGTFAGADVSAKGRAARAEKMFPRLRGPVDQFGNPKVSGGAPETVGTKEAADKWTIANDGAVHEIPLAGFYVVQLQSGNVAATVAGETIDHRSSDFWTVKAGATMSVKVLSQLAVLETIAPAKQY